MKEEKNDDRIKKTAPEPDDDESVIEGGRITELDESQYQFDPIEKHKLTTARWLAYALIGILAGSFIIHYAVMTWLASQNKTEAMGVMENTFSAWLPVISGFAGAGVTYFFTRDRNGRS